MMRMVRMVRIIIENLTQPNQTINKQYLPWEVDDVNYSTPIP